MSEARYHLAEINIARALAPFDDPVMADFVEQLDAINAMADESPGFVWSLKVAAGSEDRYVRGYDDERIIVNLSVWESLEALHSYTYRSGHGAIFRDRKKWFDTLGFPPIALWWVPAGHIPTVDEGKQRLEMLTRLGPTADAFTFKTNFQPPIEQKTDEEEGKAAR